MPATGLDVGENDFRIGHMGAIGDDNAAWPTDNEMEIFGQRIAPPHVFMPLVLTRA